MSIIQALADYISAVLQCPVVLHSTGAAPCVCLLAGQTRRSCNIAGGVQVQAAYTLLLRRRLLCPQDEEALAEQAEQALAALQKQPWGIPLPAPAGEGQLNAVGEKTARINENGTADGVILLTLCYEEGENEWQ